LLPYILCEFYVAFGRSPFLHSWRGRRIVLAAVAAQDEASEQDNFHGYHVLRITDAPDIQVQIVPNAETGTTT